MMKNRGVQLRHLREGHTTAEMLEGPTVERPWWIYVFGNDDTSFSKWVGTKQEALELLALLEAGQLLDFDKDFWPLSWVFTN